MSARLRSLLFRVGSFVLGGVLLYLALRGVDLQAIGEALRTARYGWGLPLLALTLLSLLLRAWRWQLLLNALPTAQPSEEASSGGASAPRATLRQAFASVNIGYMVNYAAPRLGEVARSANLSARSGLTLGGVFGTVVIERVLDLLSLGLIVCSTLVIFWDRLTALNETVFGPAWRQAQRLPLGTGALMAAALLALLVVAYLMARRRGMPTLAQLWRERLQPMLASFQAGLHTLTRTGRPFALFATTAGIWLCYWAMTYVPFVMLGMAASYDLSFVDALGIMVLGSLGIVVPSPGGTGSYHYITIQGLVYLFGVPAAPAATYAVLSHGAMLLFYVAGGLLCLLLQGSTLGALRRTTRTADASQETDASLSETARGEEAQGHPSSARGGPRGESAPSPSSAAR